MFIVKRCPFLCGLTHPSILDLAKDGASMTEHRLGSLCSVCGGRTRPRVLSLVPRQRLSLIQQRRFGEASKLAREARALPRRDASSAASEPPLP